MIESIRMKDIHFTYENNHEVFSGVSMIFPLDGNFAVRTFGASGRSTMIKIMAGLLMPQQGEYFLNDNDIIKMSFDEFLPYRLKIGYGFDIGGLLSNRTLRENLLLPIQYHRANSFAEDQKRVDELIDLFGISQAQNERPAHVTGALRKSCCVARAFVMEPEMLLLDDPCQGLSEGAIDMLIRLIKVYRERHGLRHVFLATNNDYLQEELECATIWIQRDKVIFDIRVGDENDSHHQVVGE